MKIRTYSYIVFITLTVSSVACNKDADSGTNSSLTLVNAISDQSLLLPVFDSNAYENAAKAQGNILQYRYYSPANHLTVQAKSHSAIFYPFNMSSEKVKPITKIDFQTNSNGAYTLILLGTTVKPDQLLISGLPPYHQREDSTFAMRFVHVAPDQRSVRIQVDGNGIMNKTIDLAFKQKSEYMIMSARSQFSQFSISVLDSATGKLLAKYQLKNEDDPDTSRNQWRNQNFTFVWLPTNVDGTWADSPFLIHDF